MTLILPRRRFLAGLVGLVAAPAVVKASSLMKIVSPRPLPFEMLSAAREEWIERMVWPPLIASDVLADIPMSILPDHLTYVRHTSFPLTMWRQLNQSADPA